MSNNLRTRDRQPPNYVDGIKVKGILLDDYFTASPTVVTTSTYSITESDRMVICSAGSGTVTLLSAVTYLGRRIEVVNRSGSTVTVSAITGQLIESAITTTVTNGSNFRFYSDGVKWFKLS